MGCKLASAAGWEHQLLIAGTELMFDAYATEFDLIVDYLDRGVRYPWTDEIPTNLREAWVALMLATLAKEHLDGMAGWRDYCLLQRRLDL